MPVAPSTYSPPLLLSGGHAQTLYASLVRSVDFEYDRRERIDTPDGDFLDLDWAFASTDGASSQESGSQEPDSHETGSPAAVIAHGLEGSSDAPYVRGMARALVRRGWDVCAWNMRGCSGEPNRRVPTYHSGKTEDLAAVLDAVFDREVSSVALVGFSLGGNLTLRYLGEQGAGVDPRIEGAVAFSVPVDLGPAARQIGRPANWHYTQYFLRSLRQTVEAKAERHPDAVSTGPMDRVRTLVDFDDAYTAPLNGFESAEAYYTRASCRPVLSDIRVPTLLVNAANDPFLVPSCYPRPEADDHPHLTLEIPESGGHVGFVSFGTGGEYWSERRAGAFLSSAECGLRSAE